MGLQLSDGDSSYTHQAQGVTANVSVIMVTWRTGKALFEAIEAVLGANRLHELILVNNGNPPDDEARLRALAEGEPRIRLIEGQGNIGFGKACNLGASQAVGENLLFLNPDAIVRPGALTALCAAAEQAGAPALIGARLVNPDGREQRGGRRGRLTLWSALVSFSGLGALSGLHPIFRDLHREREPLPDAPAQTPVVSGAAMLIERMHFAQLGGFDEAYLLHVEDIDLCRRVEAAGGEVWFAPDAEVMHYGSTSCTSIMRVEWAKAQGFVRYFWKFARGPLGHLGVVLVAPLIAAAIMVRAAFLAMFRR